MNTHPESAGSADAAAVEANTIDLSVYRVLVAGSFEGSIKELTALSGMGVTLAVVGQAGEAVRTLLEALPLDELVMVASDQALAAEAFRRASSVNLVVLTGEKADMLERTIRPLLEECAASSLNDLLPLVRMDDRSLRFLKTAKRWGYFLVGRALGLPAETARAYMEDCCGYEKQNQERESGGGRGSASEGGRQAPGDLLRGV